MIVVMGTGKTDDGLAGVSIIIFLQIKVIEREEVLVSLLTEETQVVFGGDVDLLIIIQHIGQPGEGL